MTASGFMLFLLLGSVWIGASTTNVGGPPALQADPKCRNTPEAAALISAAGVGDIEKVKTVLEQKGLHPDSLDPEDPDLETALMRAASNDHFEVVQLLLSRGADRFRQDVEGKTALMVAATLGRVHSVHELLKERPREFDGSTDIALGGKEGTYLEMRDNKGRSALLWACYNAKTATAQALVDSGANLDAADDTGRTPLMWAATSGSAAGRETATVLLEGGADVAAEDAAGATAMGWAVERGDRAMLELIAKYQYGPETELLDPAAT